MTKLLFSTDTDSGTVSVLNAETAHLDTIARVPVGNGPRGAVKFTATGRGFVTNHAGNTISELDAYSLREVYRITVGIAPIGITVIPGDRFALVSNSGDNDLSIVDLDARKEVHRIPVGREPRHPDSSPDGDFCLVPISGGDHISRVDVSSLRNGHANHDSLRETAKIHVGEGTMPYSCAISPNGKLALSANNQATYVSIIDLSSNSVIAHVDVGSKGARGTTYSPDNELAFVTIEDTDEIVVVDLNEAKVVQRFSVGPGPRGVVFDDEDNVIYASAFSRKTNNLAAATVNSISVLRLSGDTKTIRNSGGSPEFKDVSVGAGPCSVSIFRTK